MNLSFNREETPFEGSEPPLTIPLPMKVPYAVMEPGVVYGYGGRSDRVTEIDPTEIAMYVHCACGLQPMAFVAWLLGELVTLEAIDPHCSK